MCYSTPLILLCLLSFSAFLQETFGEYGPRVLAYNYFNQVEFLANGYYEENLNTLLTEILSKEILDSRYRNGFINGTYTSIIEQNTYLYGLAHRWKSIQKNRDSTSC